MYLANVLHVAMFAVALCEDAMKDLLKTPKVSVISAFESAKEAQERAHQEYFEQKKTDPDLLCADCIGKEYSEPCPEQWVEASNGSCLAPKSYAGVCATMQAFKGTARDKQEAEQICGVCWPCNCPRDWTQPCPFGYTAEEIALASYSEVASSVCSANLDYQGPCENNVEFNNSQEGKRSFSLRCGVSWPCKTVCEGIAQARCPKGWNHIGEEICSAPTTYKVKGCHILQSFHGWTSSMREKFADRCLVVWPCDPVSRPPSDGPVSPPSCGGLNLSACPQSWLQQQGNCKPGPESKTPCSESVDLSDMTDEQKLEWAGECLLKWPCEGERMQTTTGARLGFKVSSSMHGPVDADGNLVDLP